MSLSWPGTVCTLNKCSILGRSNYFQIHGLWPNGESNCDQVNWTKQDLSYKNQKDIPIFWNWMYGSEMGFINHELSKHGTCWDPSEADLQKAPRKIAELISSSNKSTKNGKLNTFLQIPITWSKVHNLFSILWKRGIRPGELTVSTLSLIRALEDHLGVKNGVYPICLSRHELKHFFSEIRFCLDANYQVVSCGEVVIRNHLQACTDMIHYPVFPNMNEKNKESYVEFK